MKHLITLISCIFTITTLRAESETQIEAYNEVSDEVVYFVQNAQIVRQINGGTIISPIYDESCPEEMKGSFAYACKIAEEYLPPCLPIQIKVSCGRVNSSTNSISKVSSITKDKFGNNPKFKNAPMSMIKGVILSELGYASTYSYLDSVPNLDFLTLHPDITITYNSRKLDDLSFSLEATSNDKYDFISIALRDILIGLGLSSSYRYDHIDNCLLNPSQKMIPFESYIDKTLGSYNDPSTRLINATKGELILNLGYQKSLHLYAPTTWENGVSLNYFIPQEDCHVSNILSHNFCKGMVTRALSDDYSNLIFRELLGWKPEFTVSSGGIASSSAGSTSLKMPYNGAISFDSDSQYGLVSITQAEENAGTIKAYSAFEYDEQLSNYIKSFHPFQNNTGNNVSEGTSISILKKDGTWDPVRFDYVYAPSSSYQMTDLEFHYDESEYARTIDGYLRARITYKHRDRSGTIEYKSIFFVVDYLPQKVNLSYTIPTTEIQSLATTDNTPVRIYFSNLEGISRVVLERLRQGFRVPSKIVVEDFKKGYFDTTIDRVTTFTAVGYNDNGVSRSVPITITPFASEKSTSISLDDNQITITKGNSHETSYEYSIVQYGAPSNFPVSTGKTSDIIDVSFLKPGIYILNITDVWSGDNSSFKFRR